MNEHARRKSFKGIRVVKVKGQNMNGEDSSLFWLRSIDQRLEKMSTNLTTLNLNTVKKTDCAACQGRYLEKWYFLGWGSCFVLVSAVFMLVARWPDVAMLFQ